MYYNTQNKGGQVLIMKYQMEEVLNVAIEDEVKDALDKLDSHKQILDTHDHKINVHDDKIQTLETNTSVLKEKMTNLEGIVTRFEANSYQTQNNMMQLLSQVIVNTSNTSVEIVKNATKNDTEIKKITLDGKFKLGLKILAVISTIALAYIGGKYGISIK